MPIIKSAIKRARQNDKRRTRRQPFRTNLKTMLRKYTDLIKEGKKDEAGKLLPTVYKSIDMAAKKQILHKNNAAHKKSNLARMLATK